MKACSITNVTKLEVIKHFSNIKFGKINESVLILVSKNLNIKNIIAKYCKFERISDFIIVHIKDVTKEFLIRKDTNIIIISDKGVPIDKLFKGIRKFLICDLKSPHFSAERELYLEEILKGVPKRFDEPINDIPNHLNYLVHLRIKNPIDILLLEENLIKEFLYLVLDDVSLNNCTFRNISCFKGKSLLEVVSWQKMINSDIEFFIARRKLTCRLARIIYKVATLDDEMSNTAIGRFFHLALNVKSTSLYDKHYGIENIKGYDLNKNNSIFHAKYLPQNNYSEEI